MLNRYEAGGKHGLRPRAGIGTRREASRYSARSPRATEAPRPAGSPPHASDPGSSVSDHPTGSAEAAPYRDRFQASVQITLFGHDPTTGEAEVKARRAQRRGHPGRSGRPGRRARAAARPLGHRRAGGGRDPGSPTLCRGLHARGDRGHLSPVPGSARPLLEHAAAPPPPRLVRELPSPAHPSGGRRIDDLLLSDGAPAAPFLSRSRSGAPEGAGGRARPGSRSTRRPP